MSRTLKDQPGARHARRDRRYAKREIPMDPPVLSTASRLAAAAFLGLTGVPTDAELAAAPCPVCTHDAEIIPFPTDVMVRAELTQYANAGW